MTNEIKQDVYDIMYAIKPQRNYIGYFQAISVITLCCENKKNMHSLYKLVYPLVAQQFNCNPQNIERNIRILLYNINYSKLASLLKLEIIEPLTVKEFIYLIVSYIDKKHYNRTYQ